MKTEASTKRIPFGSFFTSGHPFAGYCSRDPFVLERLWPGEPGAMFPPKAEALLKRVPRVSFWNSVAESLSDAGLSDRARGNIERLRGGEAVTITTGQQPGLLGGPLYSLYKALAAVTLAEYVESELSIPAVPVFWLAADDTDCSEASSTVFFNRNLSLFELSLADEDCEPGGMIGAIPRDAFMPQLEKLKRLSAQFARPDDALGLLANSGASARDAAEFSISLLSQIFARQGLVVLDSRNPALRVEGTQLIEKYLSRREDVAQVLERSGAELEARGYKVSFSGPTCRYCLYRLDGKKRTRLPEEKWDERARSILKNDPGALSCNVILRPILQDFVLPNLCYVAGPGEIDYLAQAAPVFEKLDMPFPLVFPRVSMTLVVEEAERITELYGASVPEVVLDPERLTRAFRDEHLPEGVRAGLKRMEKGLEQSFAEVERHATRIDPGLGATVESTRKRVSYQLTRLKTVLGRKAMEEKAGGLPKPGVVREFLRPRGKLQERVLNMTSPIMFQGTEILPRLFQVARMQLEDCLAGNVNHYLLGIGGNRS